MNIYTQAQALLPALINWRRYLHKHAEGAYELPQTLSLIRSVLTEHDIAFSEPCRSTIVCEIGQGPAGMILRADTDALPMQEENDLDFKSETAWAHTCGDDLHTAMLLGAACLLKAHAAELKHRTRIVFQPDEEGATGALFLCENGIITSDFCGAFALHVSPVLKSGMLYQSDGALYASANEFYIAIQGSSAHGAAPHDGHDPIFCAMQIYNALQGLISREKPPLETAALSICSLNAGSTYNIIPATAQMRGTLRTYNSALQKQLMARITALGENLAPLFGCRAETHFITDVPAVINDSTLNQRLLRTLSANTPNVHTAPHAGPFSWSEDFGYLKNILPITMMTLGAHIPGYDSNLHNAKVRFDESCMPSGVCAHVCAALSADLP